MISADEWPAAARDLSRRESFLPILAHMLSGARSCTYKCYSKKSCPAATQRELKQTTLYLMYARIYKTENIFCGTLACYKRMLPCFCCAVLNQSSSAFQSPWQRSDSRTMKLVENKSLIKSQSFCEHRGAQSLERQVLMCRDFELLTAFLYIITLALIFTNCNKIIWSSTTGHENEFTIKVANIRSKHYMKA